MFARTKTDFFFIMASGLALLGVLRALTIDNQLTVIKNDCYERLAIGQRHSPKDIYKTSHVTTVLECQLFCTKEKEFCRSFSFGIGVKGNASCELSNDPVKETADLKPIGTKADTDFDLYIKKLGCTLVIDKNNPAFGNHKPQGQDTPQNTGYGSSNSYDKPSSVNYGPHPSKPSSGGYDKPPSSGYNPAPPQSKPPDGGYGAASTARPSYSKPQDEVGHVQTVVSISTGPQKPVLHPIHDILIGDGAYSYARPPFRPSALNHPYDKPPHRPSPDDYGSRPQRPDYSSRPDPDRYDSRPGGSNLVSYGHRPIPEKYASYIPRPEQHYYRPETDDYYRPRPEQDYWRPKPSDDYGHRPNPGHYYNPSGDGYNRPSDNYRPVRPNTDYGQKPDYNNRPNPGGDYDRPTPPTGDYNQRPSRPSDYNRPTPSSSYNDRPNPSSGYSDRPNPSNSYNERPNPSNSYNERPNPSSGYSDRPNPSSSYNERPNPFSGYIDRPKPSNSYSERPNPSGGYTDRPTPSTGYPIRPINNYNHRPSSNSDYDRPNPPSDYNQKPSRPNNNYDRPNPSGSYNQKPQRPEYDRPNPPSDYNQKPQRPDYDRPTPSSDYNQKPSRPDNTYNNKPSTPNSDYDRPNPPSSGYNQKPSRPTSDYNHRPNPPVDGYNRDRPSKPTHEYLFNGEVDRYDQQKPSIPSDSYQKPGYKPDSNNPNGGGYDNAIKGSSKPKDPHSKPIVTQSIGPHGESITSIITELDEACFRRVLAGKRVTRALVKRALFCERVEDCQRECADEKRFVCEGFNYRLDPSGRGKGECELLEIPLSHLDIGRDLYPDPDYDYYERDRNAASANCKRQGYGGYGYDGYNRRNDQRPYYDNRWYDDRNSYGNRRPRPDFGYDDYDSYRPPPPGGNRRGDFAYHHSHHSDHSHNYHYEHYDHGPPPYDYKPYEPYLPPIRRPPYDEDRYYVNYHTDRERDKDYWGFHKPTWGSYGGSYGTSYNPHEFDRKNYYLPPQIGGSKDWGQYGGSYGNGGLNLQYNGYGHSQSFDFWGLNKYEEKFHNYGELPPPKKPLGGGSYLPEYKPPPNTGSYLPELPYKPPIGSGGDGYLPNKPPSGGSGGYLPGPDFKPPFSGGGGSYLPERPHGTGNYLPERPQRPPPNTGSYLPERPNGPPPNTGGYLPERPHGLPPNTGGYLPERPHRPPPNTGSYLPLPGKPNPDDFYGNSILPAEPRYPYRYDFLKDECSLRSAAGFRLHKRIVKKFYAVPNIYECELLCFKEKEFLCSSYAFRYTISSNAPSDNCYLSNRNYKELDFYTDLEPDRDFDIYTMNNMKKCAQPVIPRKENSECFWRVRSAQRLDHKVVRDSLSVPSIVECQLECLRSRHFTCRAFSYRYGSQIIGGPVDNCLLTDWPYYEMDPKVHFVPEPGFEIYERGSFGHGCEPHHFGIRGRPSKNPGARIDQLCYVGFGSPATLLPQATRKELQVATEEECKAKCSKFREKTIFQCMSFSYCTDPKRGPNCKMSDILQRDLLPNVDYVPDPDAWLFAWDNYNPECRAVANEPVHNNVGYKEDRQHYDDFAIGTWRVYSVSGWPCRRGSLCRENRQAGFWSCELEGGDANSWDYCCRPDHQCGSSEGFPYQWCYVGPSRTQWRKCSDRYYPYVHNLIDRFDRPPPGPPHHWVPSGGNYLPDHGHRPPPYRPGVRPDRPPAPPTRPPPQPSLDEYEMQFESQFLDPPKPGGFGQPRHWPLSYLHKEMPPNSTDSDSRLIKASQGRDPNPKFAAIQNLIDIIKSNDLKNVQYQITNESNKEDDILFVKIPLPTNFTEETKKSEKMVANGTSISGPIDLEKKSKSGTSRSPKSLPTQERFAPTYRKGYVTRTNVTNHSPRSSRTL
ncbi:unnamed protein product [Tenebrio molitor]|nr:unnamed protein product [Tenebrio molitor]